jgi:hypothetical protein
MPGLAAWIVGMRVLRMTPGDSAWLRLWDRTVVPVARLIETHVRAPFGKSLIAVAHVPERA